MSDNDKNTKTKDNSPDQDDEKAQDTGKKTLGLGGKGTLSLKGGSSSTRGGPASRGRGVEVEVRKRRGSSAQTQKPEPAEEAKPQATQDAPGEESGDSYLRQLTTQEREARAKALEQAREEEKHRQSQPQGTDAEEPGEKQSGVGGRELPSDDEARRKELEEIELIEAEERKRAEDAEEQRRLAEEQKQKSPPGRAKGPDDEEGQTSYRDKLKKQSPRKPSPSRESEGKRRGKLTVTQVLNQDYERDMRAAKRQKEKARMSQKPAEPPQKVSREVTVPESITVQELANRMAEPSGDVVKKLMGLGVMATINQSLDQDTAELVAAEFGHKVRRVSESDIEIGLMGAEDSEENMVPRPAVVTVMGHVDHGKTSLLDALRKTDVAAGEAGGITQHIGAYQIVSPSGAKITFLDTPGHAAFSEMRSRGANITDIVILVVAANDSLMPQTIEAINHARAAGVPMIVAINKIDLPDANPDKVKQDLLQHEVIVEDMSGDTLCVEVSAKNRQHLDKLEEAIQLQSEILELKANPKREALGTVVESKMEQGRGSVSTVLIQRGTINVGDVFVVGAEWGKVRALVDDRGNSVNTAIPGQPVEILGLSGTPDAGDTLIVVKDEARAREVSEYRHRKRRETQAAITAGSNSFEQLMARAQEGEKKELPLVIKGDVHGSVEAICGALDKMSEDNEEVTAKILHTGVGAITESDITLAKASTALVIGFNVRANAQAREMAQRDGVDIRYYNVIYNVIDDARDILTGMLSPKIREEYIGQAEIRQVFNITKVGKVAGCMVKDGAVKRGSKVRLLRDNVVIHEGTLKTLKRFKDEVREVKEGMECGMAFENYDDIREGDVIECYDVVEEARTLV